MRLGVAVVCMLGCGRFGFGFGDDEATPDAPPEPLPIAVDVAPFETASTTFVDIPGATLTIPPSPGTDWLLLTSAQLESTAFADVTVEARYLVDGTERGLGGTQNSIVGLPGPWQHFYVTSGTAAAQLVTYQLREQTGATGRIARLRAIAVPLPVAAHYASADDIQEVTSVTASPVATLSFGTLIGDYILLLLANGSDLPGLSDIYFEWQGPGGELWLANPLQMPREPWQAQMTMRRVAVDSSDANVVLRSYVRSGISQVRYARALALPTAAFPSVDFAHAAVLFTAQTTTPSLGAELLPAASTADRYLYVASLIGDEICDVTLDAHRSVHFYVGSDETAQLHATDNCVYAATYGEIGLLAAPPTRLATGLSTANGVTVRHVDSAILLLGLP